MCFDHTYQTLILLISGLIVFIGTSQCSGEFPVTETVLLHSACFGTHTKFQATCGNASKTVLGIKAVNVGAKLTSDNCPAEIGEDTTTDRNLVYVNKTTLFTDLWCCDWNQTTDCVFTYDSSIVNYTFQRQCTGLTECSGPFAVPRSPAIDGNCNDTLYMDNSNYMVMEYACINESRIVSDYQDPASLTVTDQALYVQTNGYPNATGTGSFSCSVQSNICNSGIYVYTLDIRLTDGSGQCTQSLSVTGSSFSQTWSCDHSSLFDVGRYSSSDRYLNVTFTGSQHSTDESRIWIGFEAQASGASLLLSCPPTEQVTCTDPAPVTGGDGDTDTAPATEGSAGGVGIGVIIGVVVALLLLLLLLLILLCCCYHKHWCCFKNRKVTPDDDKENLTDPDELLSARHVAPAIAPANTMFRLKQTNLFKDLPHDDAKDQSDDVPLPNLSIRLPPLPATAAKQKGVDQDLPSEGPSYHPAPVSLVDETRTDEQKAERKRKKKKKKKDKDLGIDLGAGNNVDLTPVEKANNEHHQEEKKKKKKKEKKKHKELINDEETCV